MIADYLALEGLIIARIETAVSADLGLRRIAGAADLDGAKTEGQVTPAVYVLYGGERVPAERTHQGAVQVIEQRWLAVLALKNRRDTRTGEAWRREAGPMLTRLNACLQGWRPDRDHGPLIKAAAPGPGFEAGFGYFPLAYHSRIVLKGDPS